VKIALGNLESRWTELASSTAARWASLFFSLHVLTLLLSVAASEAFLAAAAIAYLIHLLLLRSAPDGAELRRAIRFPPLKLPLLLFCLATVNSLLWAEHPAVGWVALRKLVLFLILLLSVNLVSTTRHLGALLRGLFLVAALAGLAATAQFVIQYRSVRHLHPDRVYFYMTLTRIHGFTGHWMNFGGQQMLVFSALLAFLLMSRDVIPSAARNLALLRGGSQAGDQSKIPRCARNDTVHDGKAKELYWLLLAVVATSLVLTFTRSVWLGCVVATLYVVARCKPRTLWAIPVLLVVTYLAAPSLIRRRVSLAFHPREDPALAIRLEMWGAGLRMVREHPWVGVGPGNIPLVYTQYLPPSTTPMIGYHDHLHDNFLQLAAERGLPCLIAWLWFMLALGWQILRIRRRLSSQRWVADAAFAAWLAFFAEGFFEFNFGTSPVLMVFLFVMSTPFIAKQLESPAQESNAKALVEPGG
jgi:O-antigen ligase